MARNRAALLPGGVWHKKQPMKNTDIQNTDVEAQEQLEVTGARVHNLKNIDVTIPHGKLSVITGLSGSGKSSLAFDTIYAEGQRRYIETFSAYARGMLGNMERPDVDSITGLSPVISIEQKSVNKNPRSTVGTITEVYDFLRLLYARVGEARSYISGRPMVKYTVEQIEELVSQNYSGHKILVLSPLVKNRKGHYRELFDGLQRKGYLHVRIDGKVRELEYGMKVDRYKNHSIELVVDRMRVSADNAERLHEAIIQALKQGGKQMMVLDVESGDAAYYSQLLMDAENGLSYPEPAPHCFSFNSPQGACPRCKGLGYVNNVDIDKIIPNRRKSIYDGAIEPLGKYKHSLIFLQIDAICRSHNATLHTPVEELSEEAMDEVLNGTSRHLQIEDSSGIYSSRSVSYEGVVRYIEMQYQDDFSEAKARKWSEQFYSRCTCPECGGTRLNIEARHYFVDNKNIAELSEMGLQQLSDWMQGLEERVPERARRIAIEILKEIRSRLGFLLEVGLGYLCLSRSAGSLSGGESQRIRLATQAGSQLVGVMYILDEPSIGLHQRDNERLIRSLKHLRDSDNTVIVVEHDRDIMMEADYLVDIGPAAGRKGGNVVYQGTPVDMLGKPTLTADYLSRRKNVEMPSERRKVNLRTPRLRITGAKGHNLKDVTLDLPLGRLVCVTGVSGSGKSSLISGTLQPILSQYLYRSQQSPLPYSKVTGLDRIDKVVTVDQSPIGRTPRSNPATYTGLFTDIRQLFVKLPDAQVRGYKPGRFSFNVAGGRCELCKGNGYRVIEMNFLPDVLVPCEACQGRRYNRETLEVRFKGKSIADVLDMTVNMAVEFFENQPMILRKVKTLQDVGLGYLKLGQPASTLSGGENQRVKLASELARRDTGKTLYILDEPTTGLHFQDISVLMSLLQRLVERGNTVVVIEHNLDVIKCADWIIDLGPEGGCEGGEIVAEGTPEQIAATSSPTAVYLAKELDKSKKG